MNRKTIYRSILAMCYFFVIQASLAQAPSTIKSTKKYKYTIYAGVGPNYYFNNLVLGKDYVNELNYSFVTRFMWEPEHFVSLGFETGYNRLYTLTGDPAVVKGTKIINAAIPIQFVVSMKFLQHFYGNFSLGQSIRVNKVIIGNSSNTDFNATNFSLGDFGMGVGYKKLMGSRFYLATELKGFYSSKLDDTNLGLVFMGGYRF